MGTGDSFEAGETVKLSLAGGFVRFAHRGCFAKPDGDRGYEQADGNNEKGVVEGHDSHPRNQTARIKGGIKKEEWK